MKLHPRHSIVTEARHDIAQAVTRAVTKHDITYGELFSILAGEMAGWAKYAIREERHPDDPDTPGDVE
jgi:hypothetical protein